LGFIEDLESEVKGILHTGWNVRDGRQVPEPETVSLGNDAVKLDGTVLYADLAESTKLVKGYKWWFAAAVYKCYLRCAAKVIRKFNGTITAFDGDRIMAVYIGEGKDSDAARTALAINHAVWQIINPQVELKYPNSGYTLRQAVGVDTSVLHVARTGIRGSNDLVWVGNAANSAAKLSSLRIDGGYASWVTKAVYDNMSDLVKISQTKRYMWEKPDWTVQGTTVYGSKWYWSA